MGFYVLVGWLKLVCYDSYEISFKMFVKSKVLSYGLYSSNIFERRK